MKQSIAQEKTPQPHIVQITSSTPEGYDTPMIFGLGADGMMYYWNRRYTKWIIEKE